MTLLLSACGGEANFGLARLAGVRETKQLSMETRTGS